LTLLIAETSSYDDAASSSDGFSSTTAISGDEGEGESDTSDKA